METTGKPMAALNNHQNPLNKTQSNGAMADGKQCNGCTVHRAKKQTSYEWVNKYIEKWVDKKGDELAEKQVGSNKGVKTKEWADWTMTKTPEQETNKQNLRQTSRMSKNKRAKWAKKASQMSKMTDHNKQNKQAERASRTNEQARTSRQMSKTSDPTN